MTEPIPKRQAKPPSSLDCLLLTYARYHPTGDRPLTRRIWTPLHACPRTALLIDQKERCLVSRYLLDEDEITVGRDPERIFPPAGRFHVSRQHAVFRRVTASIPLSMPEASMAPM